jgi:cobalt-zinc-cadmium efflux system protein
MSHDHSGGHAHSHTVTDYGRAFLIGIGLNLTFVVAEFFYGKLSHSLALIADAGHNLGDVFGLVLAWGAAALSRTNPTRARTYGLRRSSVLAALINAVVLLISIGAIGWEAILRLRSPGEVAESTVVYVALAGVVINGTTALLFMRGRRSDLNIRGAYAHMAADAAITLGVAVAGIVILFTRWMWLDPVVSLAIVILIGIGTWDLLRDSFNLAMDAVPETVNSDEVEQYLRSLPGCQDVHDLHIWGLSTTEVALTAHLVLADGNHVDEKLSRIDDALHRRFGIEHSTIQIESNSSAAHCRRCETL